MAFWKQSIVALVLLAAAAVAWASFFPGAGHIMAHWGIDWAAATPQPQSQRASGGAAGSQGPGAAGGQRQGTPIVAGPIKTATINDRLSAIGTGAANQSVAVTPYATGRIETFEAVSGSAVKAGDVIARLDSQAEEIARDRARIAVDNARATLDRINTLKTANTATAVQVREAELAYSNARLALRDAELTLDRRVIKAPIAGVVGILPIAAGNYVNTQSQIATIDDRSRVIVDFWAPERFATMIKVGAPVTASPVARPADVFQGVVSAVDSRIDAASRTIHVQAALPNVNDALRAGMSFQVEMRFPGDTFPAVDPLAIQWGTDGAFVWAIEQGKAKRVPVRIIQRNTESVLVEAAALQPGGQVVTEGVQTVREGGDVMIAGGGQRARDVQARNIAAPAGGGS